MVKKVFPYNHAELVLHVLENEGRGFAGKKEGKAIVFPLVPWDKLGMTGDVTLSLSKGDINRG